MCVLIFIGGLAGLFPPGVVELFMLKNAKRNESE